MGSPNGIWTAVSGGMAQSQNLDVIANNLANANTTGYKKDSTSFKEYLTAVERPPSPAIDIPRTIFKDSDFYHFDGREHSLVNVDRVLTDHTQGNLKPTNAPFDVAVDGPGFFAVQTPSGIMFTRAGDFKVNGTGQLVTTEGHQVLSLGPEAAAAKAAAGGAAAGGAVPGSGAPQDASRNPASVNPFSGRTNVAAGGATESPLKPISLQDAIASGQKITITNDGEVYAGTEQVGILAVAEFSDPRLLKKETSALYSNPNEKNVARVSVNSKVRQGFLEGSNVNPVSELVDLLKANRMYESNMRAIKAYNDMSGKEANEVGKL